jgi:hypothetical protein
LQAWVYPSCALLEVLVSPVRHAWPDKLESVDGWPMAITIYKTLGGKPIPVTALA